MPEDRLERIESKIDLIASGLLTLAGEVTTLTGEVTALRRDVAVLEVRIDRLDARLEQVEIRLTRLETRVDKLEVGHELLIDSVKQLAEGHLALHEALGRGFADLREYCEIRIDPLERTVRKHSAILKSNKLH